MSVSDSQTTFIEHLEELRKVIFRILIAVIILLPAMFFFADNIVDFIVKHSCPKDFTLRYFAPMEPLFVKIKISLLAAFFLAIPYIAWIVWQFIVPALYPSERRHIKQLACSSWLLFVAGIIFCFYFILPAMMRFSLGMESPNLEAAIGLSNYISLIGMLLLGFGIMFQLPIVIFFSVLSGIIKLDTLKKQRAIVLIIILTLSAILTPPDIFSQLMMTIPTYMLFELSLVFSAMALKVQKNTPVRQEHISADNDDTPSVPPEENMPQPAGTKSQTDSHKSDNFNKYYRPHITKRKLRSRSSRKR